jgi:hypothetical protein
MKTATSYPKSRIWFGIISIGGNLFLPWFLYFSINQGIISFPEESIKNIALRILGYFIIVCLFNLGWDCLTGFIAEKQAKRYTEKFKKWFLDWISGSAIMLFLQFFGGLILALIVVEKNFPQLVSLAIVECFLLTIAWSLYYYHFFWIPKALKKPYFLNSHYQEELEKELLDRGVSMKKNADLFYFYQSGDGSTVNGGSIGGGKYRRYMISSASVEKLIPTELALLIWRDETMTIPSQRLWNLCYALGYCFLGLLLASSSVEFAASSFWGRWFWLIAFLSSWFFLALLLWPAYSRRNYLAADRRVIEAGVNPQEYKILLEKLQKLNATEEKIPSWIEYMFHPIPSLDKRLSQITPHKKL